MNVCHFYNIYYFLLSVKSRSFSKIHRLVSKIPFFIDDHINTKSTGTNSPHNISINQELPK